MMGVVIADPASDGPPWIRNLELPDGRGLLLRPVSADDVDGLAELYRGLSMEDLHRRFFPISRPNRAFLERVTVVDERGGFGLVAQLSHGDDDGRIVGDAGYELLPDGDGELAITMARPGPRAQPGAAAPGGHRGQP